MKYFLLCCLLLAGCYNNMSDEEIQKAQRKCIKAGGDPMVMTRIDGTVKEVRCW